MPKITSVSGRLVYNSRGSQTIEVDVTTDGTHTGRVSAPSGASVGMHEAASFPKNAKDGPAASLRILRDNTDKILGADPDDISTIHDIIREIDPEPGYPNMGGSLAFALSIAAAESAASCGGVPLYAFLREQRPLSELPQSAAEQGRYRFPFPLGNILGGGAHAGPGTPDIQEILVCATGSRDVQDAAQTNLSVHAELRRVLQGMDAEFSGGKGDEGGWAPRLDNEKALEAAARACENLGYTLGREVSLGVDFASSTQWDAERSAYVYDRAGFVNGPGEQIEFASDLISRYKLAYAEDAVHEEAFDEMAQLRGRFPDVMITGDDLTVTNAAILRRAIETKSCSAAILKVNQAGGLYDALEFAVTAARNGISTVTSHRSGESSDSHISHIGIAAGSKMLKVGVVGGERVAKINELLRLHHGGSDESRHDLIQGMAELHNP